MILPETFVQSLITTLWSQSLYAAILFPLIWVIAKLCRGKHPMWHHGLWLLILVRLVIPPDTAFTFSASNLLRSFALKNISGSFSDQSTTSYDYNVNEELLVTPFFDDPVEKTNNLTQKILTRKPLYSTIYNSVPFYYSVFCVWSTVVVCLFVSLLKKRHQFWEIARNGKTIRNPDVIAIANMWQKRLHIRRQIIFKVAASNVPAFTIGLIQPVVVLPDRLILTPGKTALETVLAHELVHVKRWHDLSIYLQELIRIVYFFNPIVWYIMPRLIWTREAACDAAVLCHSTISPKTYGRQMLEFLKHQTVTDQLSQNFAKFSSAAKGMAFRLTYIQKENIMKPYLIKSYLGIFILGLFFLPMAPMVSSGQSNTGTANPDTVSQHLDMDNRQTGENPLVQYIQSSVTCQNLEEVASIIWNDDIQENFQRNDFSRLAAATDFDIVSNIGDGTKVYVFYLLGNSRRGVYRPNFHFVIKQNKLIPIFKSHNVSTYMTDQPKINGRYQIVEGWRADLFNGIYDERVKLAWADRVWFWTGTQYLPAYTDYTVKKAIDPSLLGIQRKWNSDTQSMYEKASRK